MKEKTYYFLINANLCLSFFIFKILIFFDKKIPFLDIIRHFFALKDNLWTFLVSKRV